MWIAPQNVYEKFKAGQPIDEIARKHDTEPEFIEALIRAVAVGIDMAQSRCCHDETLG